MTRRLFLLPLSTLFAVTACVESDLVEKTGPAFELSDADPSKTFEAKITFEPTNARSGSAKAFDISASLTRASGADPIDVEMFVTASAVKTGEYASTEVGADPRTVELGVSYLNQMLIQFVKRGPGTIKAEWTTVLDPEISEYPTEADEPTPKVEIKAVDG